MILKVSFTHLGGSRKGRAETFELTAGRELTFGRDPSCDIRYAENRDVVSRKHVKITLADARRPELLLVDLQSSNGTFVNNQRVFGSLKLHAGDVISLGAGGPGLKVEFEPAAAKAPIAPAATIPPPVKIPAARPAQSPPRAARTPRRRRLVLVPLAGLAAAAAGVYFYATRVQSGAAQAPGSAPADSVVLIERRWKLVDAESGRPLYHLFAPNHADSGSSAALVLGAEAFLPVFALIDGKLEPVVATSDGGGRNRPITGASRSSGFFAGRNGIILTTREAESQARLSPPAGDAAGMLIVADSKLRVTDRTALVSQLLPKWARAAASAPVEGELKADGVRLEKRLRGRFDSSNYVVRGEDVVAAEALSAADPGGLAALRIAGAGDSPALELSPDPAPIRPGEAVTVWGYPATTGIEQARKSRAVPFETRITRAAPSQFELASGPGAVHAGAPVLGASGKVIGVLQPRNEGWFAIPSRNGMEMIR